MKIAKISILNLASMARQIPNHRSLNYSLTSESATPPPSPGQHGPGDHKKLYKRFTKTFEELVPTATMYTAPTYMSSNSDTRPGRTRKRNSETTPTFTPARPLIAQTQKATENSQRGRRCVALGQAPDPRKISQNQPLLDRAVQSNRGSTKRSDQN